MFAQFAFALVASSLLSFPPLVTVPDPRSPWLHPMPGVPGAEDDVVCADPLPRIVRNRIEEVAGGAPVHHQAIGKQHGFTIYTARFIDHLSGVEQLITVAPNGRIMYLEPYLLTAPRSTQPHCIVHNTEAVTIPTLPEGTHPNISRGDWLEVPAALQTDQGRGVAPASRKSR